MDFKDVSSVPANPAGKQQHVVEVFNFVDAGTSILLDAQVQADFHAQTALKAIIQFLQRYGLPPKITFDRDPRFVGGATGRDFPSPLVRFLLCLGVQPNICPPHRPDKNAFVERYHRTFNQECIQAHRPQTLEQARCHASCHEAQSRKQEMSISSEKYSSSKEQGDAFSPFEMRVSCQKEVSLERKRLES